MIFSRIKGFLSGYAVQLLAGALAVSALGNVAQFYYGSHQAAKKVECVTAVKQTTENAKKDKAIVEVRQRKTVDEVTSRVTVRIADATSRLHDGESRIGNPSGPAGSPGPATPEGGATIVLPLDDYRNDQRICVTNTILAEEWQLFYGTVKTIREEQYGTGKSDGKGSRVSSLGRGVGAGSLQGREGNLDLGTGGGNTERLPGVAVQGQPSAAGGMSSGVYRPAEETVSPGSAAGLQD